MDNWKHFEFGLLDGGNITFSGLYDPADTTGQDALKLANVNQTDITTLRLYIDNTSYFEPCATTGYWTPANTTGNDSELSKVNCTAYTINADKGALVQTDFTLKVSGCMVLV